MDTLILLGSFFVLMMIGVPIAYSLGLAALAGAPRRSVDSLLRES